MSGPGMHLEDGALVRLLDGQPAPGEDAGHLGGCAVCQARLRKLERLSAGFSRVVAAGRAAEPAPPADLWQRVQAAAGGGVRGGVAGGAQGMGAAGGAGAAGAGVVDLARERERRAGRGRVAPRRAGLPGSPAARAAAVAALLVGGALSAEPVRAWIADGFREVIAALGGGGADPVPVRVPSAAESAAPAITVSFVPAGDRLLLRIDEPQPTGSLVVVFEDRTDAVGEVLTEDEDASLVVLPDGFRARNAGGRDWSYRFRVPGTLAGVRVVIGGRTVAELTPADGSAVLELGSPTSGGPPPGEPASPPR